MTNTAIQFDKTFLPDLLCAVASARYHNPLLSSSDKSPQNLVLKTRWVWSNRQLDRLTFWPNILFKILVVPTPEFFFFFF